MITNNWNACISTWLYPLVLPIESITWAHREWGRQRFIEGDLFAHVWPQQPNQAMQSKTNTALQTDSKFFKTHCTEHYCVVVLVVDRGEAELKASSEVNMDEQGALEQVGRAGHNQASVGYSSPCVYNVHKVQTGAQSNGFVALNDWQRLRRLSDIGAAVVGQGQSRPRLFPLQNSFRCQCSDCHSLAGCIHYQISKTFMAWTITHNELF